MDNLGTGVSDNLLSSSGSASVALPVSRGRVSCLVVVAHNVPLRVSRSLLTLISELVGINISSQFLKELGSI